LLHSYQHNSGAISRYPTGRQPQLTFANRVRHDQDRYREKPVNSQHSS
jgi:hypothetical protein